MGDHRVYGLRLGPGEKEVMGMIPDDSYVPIPPPGVRVCFKVLAPGRYDGAAVGLEKKLIPGTEDEIYWVYSVEDETFMVDALVWRVLKAIGFRQIKMDASKLETEVSICVTTTGPMPSLYFSPDLLAALAELKVFLDIDIILTA